jgi:LysM repeat protein
MKVNVTMAALGVALTSMLTNLTVSHANTNNQQPQQYNKPAAITTAAPAPKAKTPVMVAVQAGDSLVAIASAHQTTYQRIYNANPDITDPNVIYPGQQVRIPDADEQLTDRPLPQPVAAVSAAPARTTSSTRSTVIAAPAVAGGGQWDALAQCEAGGNWATNTGNGYYGGLQFTLSSWQGVGGSGLPSDASREEQIARAQMLAARSGMGAWPACSAKLGLL